MRFSRQAGGCGALLRRAGEATARDEPDCPLCTPIEYARRITIDSVKNVAHTGADIDETLAELDASVSGRPSAALLSSKPDLDSARIVAGAGMTSVQLACPTEHSEAIELTLVDGAWKRARDHAAD